MKSKSNQLSIVTPALNEVGSLRHLVMRIDVAMKAIGYDYELIVVDDHSTDGTARLTKTLAKSYPVRLLTKQGERGKAQSLHEGFAVAQYGIIAMIDADLQYPPEALGEMLFKLKAEKADIVVTRREVNETNYLRKLSSFIFNFTFARLLHGLTYDTQSGLKLFRSNVLDGLSLKATRWNFDLEFIVRARQNGAVIVEQPIIFGAREVGEAKINLVGAAFEMAKASTGLKINLLKERTAARRGYQS